MGKRLHLEVLPRCGPFLSMLIRRGKWTRQLTENLWQAARNRHSAEVIAIFKIMGDVLKSDKVRVLCLTDMRHG